MFQYFQNVVKILYIYTYNTFLVKIKKLHMFKIEMLKIINFFEYFDNFSLCLKKKLRN